MVEIVRPNPGDISTLLELAEERVESAESLIKIENYRDAISRAYYAFFDAASAMLLSKGYVAKTHKGLILLFRQHFIKTEQFPEGIGRWLAKAEIAREEADYEYRKTFSNEQAEAVVRAAKQFIDEIKKLISNDHQ